MNYGVLTRRRLLAAGAVVLGIVALAFVLVGWLAARDHQSFDWELASIFGTAVGTTLLALSTGYLAYTTSGDVRATWELARLTKSDQDARERPVVVMLGAEWGLAEASANTGTLHVTLRNVGLGPALRLVIETNYADDRFPVRAAPGHHAGIMPGETVSFAMPVLFERVPLQIDPARFPVSGTFIDRSQSTEYTVITEWKSAPTMRWHDPNDDNYGDLTGKS